MTDSQMEDRVPLVGNDRRLGGIWSLETAGVLLSLSPTREETSSEACQGRARFQQQRDASCHQVFFFSLQGKAPKEIYAILAEKLACFLPNRAKDLSAPYMTSLSPCRRKQPILPKYLYLPSRLYGVTAEATLSFVSWWWWVGNRQLNTRSEGSAVPLKVTNQRWDRVHVLGMCPGYIKLAFRECLSMCYVFWHVDIGMGRLLQLV